MSHFFQARYNGRCGACDERIHEGDLIQYDAVDAVIHFNCAAHEPPERKVQPICPSCFTELPVTGVCGACEC